MPNTLNKYRRIQHLFEKARVNCFVSENVNIRVIEDTVHFSIFFVNERFYLAVVHFPSNIYTNSESQRLKLTSDLFNKIIIINKNNCPVYIIGDFNVNPFSSVNFYDSFVTTIYFENSMKNKGQKDKYYSPVLNEYFDRRSSKEGNGTYFYSKNGNWMFLDQLLMNKRGFDKYVRNSFKFLSRLGNDELVTNHKINKVFSDHLPIVFEIEL